MKSHFSALKLAGPFIFVLGAIFAHAQPIAGVQDGNPSPQDPKFAQAEAALEQQNFTAALPLLIALTIAYPSNATVAYDLGYTQDALDRPFNAESAYRKAVQLKPGYAEAHLALGLLLARQNYPDESRAELQAVVSSATADNLLKSRAYRALAHLNQTPHPSDAQEELIQALKLSSETPEDTLLAAELAEGANDPARAEQAYRRVLAATPNDTQATDGMAHVLFMQKRLPEAESLLTFALAQNPNNPSLSAQLVAVYVAENKLAEALSTAEALHAAHSNDSNLSRLLAHLYDQQGQWEKADLLYAALILQLPEDPTLLDERADVLIHLHRPSAAETLLKAAVAKPDAFPNPQNLGLAAGHLAFAASEADDPVTTLQALALRAKVLPPSPSSLYLEATANDKLHQNKKAINLYRQFLAAAGGKFPEEESEVKRRLPALERIK